MDWKKFSIYTFIGVMSANVIAYITYGLLQYSSNNLSDMKDRSQPSIACLELDQLYQAHHRYCNSATEEKIEVAAGLVKKISDFNLDAPMSTVEKALELSSISFQIEKACSNLEKRIMLKKVKCEKSRTTSQ